MLALSFPRFQTLFCLLHSAYGATPDIFRSFQKGVCCLFFGLALEVPDDIFQDIGCGNCTLIPQRPSAGNLAPFSAIRCDHKGLLPVPAGRSVSTERRDIP